MPDIDAYHAALVATGLGLLLAFWIPRFLSGREPATSFLLLLFGCLAFALLPSLPAAPDPIADPGPWELASELCVVVALFGTGLRIDRVAVWSRSVPTVRLLVFAMPLTIALVALATYLILRVAAHGTKWLNPIALRIGTRIMGLLLAAIAIQFMLNALKAIKPDWFN